MASNKLFIGLPLPLELAERDTSCNPHGVDHTQVLGGDSLWTNSDTVFGQPEGFRSLRSDG